MTDSEKLDAIIKQLSILSEEVTRLRELNEQALAPLIDGYIEIKEAEAKKPLNNPSKN